jgi:threonine synthase
MSRGRISMHYQIYCEKCGIELTDKISAGKKCPECNGSLRFKYDYDKIKGQVIRKDLPGIWKYINLLPLSKDGNYVTYSEGDTPLLRSSNLAEKLGLRGLFIKDETQNPTGSFKDRAAAVSLTKAVEFKKDLVAIGSGGNAAASAAAYAARANLDCFVFLPATTPMERVAQSLIYGAKVIRVKGSINDAINLISKYQDEFDWYELTTAKPLNPYQGEAVKTIAFEICEQMKGVVPDWVITPVGGGGILSQCWKGFNEYKQLGLIDSLPKMAGVQPAGCAPLIKAFDDKCKPDEIKVWEGKPESIAVTIADVFPIDGEAALSAIYESGGVAEKTTDEEIIEAMRLMAQNEGVFAEPAGAAPLAAVKKLRDKGIIGSDETVVVVATGHGLKDLNAVVSNVKRPPILESEEELPLIVKRYLG